MRRAPDGLGFPSPRDEELVRFARQSAYRLDELMRSIEGMD
jgi:hypothetical protein